MNPSAAPLTSNYQRDTVGHLDTLSLLSVSRFVS